MTTNHPWQAAAAMAARAHRDQLRKDGATPYVSHPVRVALTVALRFGVSDEAVIAAALLHDVIEDTTIDYDDLAARFGTQVADLVAAVSKDPRLPEPERERRYDEQLAKAPWQARLIKLADVYDNLTDAADDTSRRKLTEKAERALKLAEKDPQLTGPRTIVGALVKQVRDRR